jgi:UDP-glucose 4-epimerase
MKVLITGATGKVGSRLTSYLIEKGDEVRVLVRDAKRADQRAEIIEGDLTNLADLDKAVAGVDAIIHTAAAFRGVSDETQQAINYEATVNLAKAALKSGVKRFIFSSTTNVYLENTLGRPASEEDTPTGTPMYPASKIKAEKALHDLLDGTSTELIITRYGLVYGDNDPHLNELAPYLAERNPDKLNSLLHHHDLDRATHQILHSEHLPHDLYNLVDDHFTTIAELLEVTGLEPSTVTGETNLYESASSNARLKKDLDFTFSYPTIFDAKKAGTL